MIKYPSIDQFRNVIHKVKSNHDYQGRDSNDDAIYFHASPYPVLSFHGTIKLHGTNCSIVKYFDKIEFQSREHVISIQDDNNGFCREMSSKNLDFLFKDIPYNNHIGVYGEWCGGSIQGKVALSGLPKMFVIFGYKVDDVWIDTIVHDNSQGIYHIEQFPTWDVDIDFSDPLRIQNTLVDLTDSVEQECPVGKHFGVSGTGEGIVWTCKTNPDYKFKVKGKKHSVSKVKTIAAIDVELLDTINDFVEYAVTDNRLEQAYQYLLDNHYELTQKSTGPFLQWVNRDIIKEESDVMLKNGLEMKTVASKLSEKARFWYFDKIKIYN